LRYEFPKGAESYLAIYTDKIKFLRGNYPLDVKIMGRNLLAYNSIYSDVGFTKSFATEEVKSFIIKINEKSVEFLQKYELNDNDKLELEQTIKILGRIKEILEEQKSFPGNRTTISRQKE
jgi:hypothetical protein